LNDNDLEKIYLFSLFYVFTCIKLGISANTE